MRTRFACGCGFVHTLEVLSRSVDSLKKAGAVGADLREPSTSILADDLTTTVVIGAEAEHSVRAAFVLVTGREGRIDTFDGETSTVDVDRSPWQMLEHVDFPSILFSPLQSRNLLSAASARLLRGS